MKKELMLVVIFLVIGIAVFISGCDKKDSSFSYESDFRPMLETEFDALNKDFYTDIKDLKVCRFMFMSSIYDEGLKATLNIPKPDEFISVFNQLGDDVLIHTEYVVEPSSETQLYEYVFYLDTRGISDKVIMEALDAIDFRYRFEVGEKILEERNLTIFETLNTSQTSIWEDY